MIWQVPFPDYSSLRRWGLLVMAPFLFYHISPNELAYPHVSRAGIMLIVNTSTVVRQKTATSNLHFIRITRVIVCATTGLNPVLECTGTR